MVTFKNSLNAKRNLMIKSTNNHQQISPQREFQPQEENTSVVFEMTVPMASQALRQGWVNQ